MAISITLREFLDTHHLPYETYRHPHSSSSRETAELSWQSPEKLAKSVLLRDGEHYLLAVLPADQRVHLGELHRQYGHHLGLATEAEVAKVFADCETGAIPPSGLLYDIDTLVEDSLLDQPDVFFEGGDHSHLVHMMQRDFRRLLGDATHAHFSQTH